MSRQVEARNFNNSPKLETKERKKEKRETRSYKSIYIHRLINPRFLPFRDFSFSKLHILANLPILPILILPSILKLHLKNLSLSSRYSITTWVTHLHGTKDGLMANPCHGTIVLASPSLSRL